MRLEHDREVLKWKNENDSSQRKSEILDSIETSLKDTMYLGFQPTICEFKDVIFQKKAGKEMCLAVPDRLENEITTLGVSCLQLACRVTTPYEVVQNLFQNQAPVYSVEEVMKCFETVVAVAIEEGVCHPIEACNIAKNKVEENIAGYQIIGDNLDLHINVKHMSNDNKNDSLHMFNIVAIKDDVSGKSLPDHSRITVEEIKVEDFLPSARDIDLLKRDFIPIWTRVLGAQLEKFSLFRPVVVWHIPHEYSAVMQQPSKVVRLIKSLKH